MADNLKMAVEGTQFSDGAISIAWATGRDSSEVVAVPPSERTSRLLDAIHAGTVVETTDPVTEYPSGTPSLFVRLSEAFANGQVPTYNESTGLFDPGTGGGASPAVSAAGRIYAHNNFR